MHTHYEDTYRLVESTLNRYCHRCDDGDIEGLVGLFTEDATFRFEETTAIGQEAIGAYFAGVWAIPQLRGKHLTANVVIDLDGDNAQVTSDFVFFRFSRGRLVPMITGRYDDRLVRRTDAGREEGSWLFESRLALPLKPAD